MTKLSQLLVPGRAVSLAWPRLRLAPLIAVRHDIDGLDASGKGHGEINVTARDVEIENVGDQRGADEKQKSKREHLRRRMPLDEGRDRLRSEIHDEDGHRDGGDHHLDMVGHADRGDDRNLEDAGEHRVDDGRRFVSASPSMSLWISRVAFHSKNRPPAMRMRSRQEKS